MDIKFYNDVEKQAAEGGITVKCATKEVSISNVNNDKIDNISNLGSCLKPYAPCTEVLLLVSLINICLSSM